MRMGIAAVVASLAFAVAACDELVPEDGPSPEKLAMERACALDVRGAVTVTNVLGPVSGTIVIGGDDKHALTVQLQRDTLFAAEAPFLSRTGDPSAPLAFTGAGNRFLGAGTTGNDHSEVSAALLGIPATASQCGVADDAVVDVALRLVFENGVAAVTGGFTYTFRERRANVIVDADSSEEHVEQRSAAITAHLDAPLQSARTPECEEAIAAFNESQAP
jgi:hypothetical protein